MITTFEQARKIIYEEIGVFSGCTLKQIYNSAFKIYKNHELVRAFLLNEGYEPSQIYSAKHYHIKEIERNVVSG